MIILPAPPVRVVHVAPSGNDSATGTAAAPFRTIGRAARVLEPGDVCRIRPGRYPETVTLPVSGKEGRPIRFEAAPGGAVVVAGDDPIVGWTEEGDVWTAPAPPLLASKMNAADQLFVDGRALGRSQWPAPGPDVSRPIRASVDKFVSKKRDGDKRLTTVVFEDDALEKLRPADVIGGAIYVQPNFHAWSWTLSGTVVALEGKKLTLETRADTGKDGQQDIYADGSRYSLFPRSAFVGASPAYVVDREAAKVRLRLAPGDDPAKHRVTMKRRDFAFDLTDRSHVVISGLDLHACSITTDRDAGGDSVGYEADGKERYPWRPVGFVAPSEDVTLENLDVTYPNSVTDVSGHFFFQYGANSGLVLSGSRHVVKGCRVRFADVNGITLSGRGHRCLENIVEDANLVAVDGAAIATGPSGPNEDIEIARNTIRRTGRSGIGLRGWSNSSAETGRSRLHHNDVRDFMLQDWDGGGFYAIGHDGRFARIDHNLFQVDAYRAESMVFGIYFDYCKNYVADHNVVLGTVTPIQITREFDPNYSRVNNLMIINNTAIPNGSEWGRPFFSSLNRGSVAMNNLLRVATWKKPEGGTVNHWPEYGTEGKSENNVVYGDDPDGYYTRADRLPKGDQYIPNVAWSVPALLPSFALPAGVPIPVIRRDGWTVPAVGSPWVGAVEPGKPMFPVGAPPFRKAGSPQIRK